MRPATFTSSNPRPNREVPTAFHIAKRKGTRKVSLQYCPLEISPFLSKMLIYSHTAKHTLPLLLMNFKANYATFRISRSKNLSRAFLEKKLASDSPILLI